MLDTATLRRRGLFRYFDGAKHRNGDTLTIQFRLQAACPDGDIRRLGDLLDALAGTAPASAEGGRAIDPLGAMVALAPIVGAGFDLPDFCEDDASGLSVQERISLLTDFYASLALDAAPEEFAAEGEPAEGGEAEAEAAVEPAPETEPEPATGS